MDLAKIKNAIFERIGDRIDDTPCDGLTADGGYSEELQLEQIAYTHGMRSARLAAITLLDEMQATE
jgi:hypothetical protein